PLVLTVRSPLVAVAVFSRKMPRIPCTLPAPVTLMLPVLLDVADTPLFTPETLPLMVIAVLPVPPVTIVLMPSSSLEVIAPLAVIAMPPLPPAVTRASIPWRLELIVPLVIVMPPVAVLAAIPRPKPAVMLLGAFTDTLPPPTVPTEMPKSDDEIVP